MKNEVYIYRTRTDFEGKDGRMYSGLRWVIRNANGDLLTTKKGKAEAEENARNNLGSDVKVNWEVPK